MGKTEETKEKKPLSQSRRKEPKEKGKPSTGKPKEKGKTKTGKPKVLKKTPSDIQGIVDVPSLIEQLGGEFTTSLTETFAKLKKDVTGPLVSTVPASTKDKYTRMTPANRGTKKTKSRQKVGQIAKDFHNFQDGCIKQLGDYVANTLVPNIATYEVLDAMDNA